jgi:hypothetical protein
MAWA